MADDDQENEKTEEEAEATGEGQEGEGTLEPPKTSSKKLLIIGIVAGVLLLGGIGAGLYFSGVFGTSAPENTTKGEQGENGEAPGQPADEHGDTAAATPEEGGEHGEEAGKPTFFPLGDILVNLQGDGKHPNFLKIKISLELAAEKDSQVLETLKPRIIDNFQIYLRELRVEDLRGSAGLFRLREELLLRVSEVVKPVRVKDVLFQEMLVQ